MTMSSHTDCSQEEAERLEIEAEMTAFAYKLHDTLEDARSKMTEEERERAEEYTDAILKKASEDAQLSRKRA